MPEGQQPEIVPTKITVTEGKHRKVNFGVGYGSEEQARAKIDWRHVNFFGGARTMQLDRPGLARSIAAFASTSSSPRLPAPRYGLTVSGQSWHNDEPAYMLDTHGGSVTIERPLARPGPYSQRPATTTLSFTYTNQYRELSSSPRKRLDDPTFRDTLIALGLNPETGAGKGLLSSLDVRSPPQHGGNPAGREDRLYCRARTSRRRATGCGGNYNYSETILEGRGYLALGPRALIAVRARGGSIRAIG